MKKNILEFSNILLKIGIFFIFILSLKGNNFNNDTIYTNFIFKHAIITKEWIAVNKNKIPKYMLQFAVTSTNPVDIKKGKILLIPNNFIYFYKNHKFKYIFVDNANNTYIISGNWEVDDGQLILTLTKNYSSSYTKGTILKYKIEGINRDKLYLKGEKGYPDINILKSSNNPIVDMEKILKKIEKRNIKQRVSQIFKTREQVVTEIILNKIKKREITPSINN